MTLLVKPILVLGNRISVYQYLVTWAARTWEGHKTQAQPSLCLWGVPEYLNLSSLDLGSAYNPGPASDSSQQSNLEPKQCRWGKHTCHEWEPTQCGRDTVSTLTHASVVCSIPLSPQHNWTSEPKKVSTTARLVSGWKSDTEESSK